MRTLARAFDDWIKAQTAAVDFTNDSEYIRDLIGAASIRWPGVRVDPTFRCWLEAFG